MLQDKRTVRRGPAKCSWQSAGDRYVFAVEDFFRFCSALLSSVDFQIIRIDEPIEKANGKIKRLFPRMQLLNYPEPFCPSRSEKNEFQVRVLRRRRRPVIISFCSIFR